MPPRLLANRTLVAGSRSRSCSRPPSARCCTSCRSTSRTCCGYDALQTGVGFLLPTAFVVAGSALAGPVSTRFGLRRHVVAALAIGALGAARARPGDVAERLLRRARPRAHPAQHRRRRRVHHDVHRRRHGRGRPRAGRRLGIASTADPGSAPPSASPLLVLVATPAPTTSPARRCGSLPRTGSALPCSSSQPASPPSHWWP